jgi:hypothetical protein
LSTQASAGAAGKARILITGASGCVGQHLAALLHRETDAQLLLWLRDPAKLTAVPADDPRITLLVGDLRDVTPHRAAIASATRIIHTATAWGDPERAHQVNVVAVKEMLAATDPSILEQVVYFSTASILNRDLQLLPEAMGHGTEYIQTKAQCLEQLSATHWPSGSWRCSRRWCSVAASMAAAASPPATSPPACGRRRAGCGWRNGCGLMPPSISFTLPILPASARTWPPTRIRSIRNRIRGRCDAWCSASRW